MLPRVAVYLCGWRIRRLESKSLISLPAISITSHYPHMIITIVCTEKAVLPPTGKNKISCIGMAIPIKLVGMLVSLSYKDCENEVYNYLDKVKECTSCG